MLPAINVIVKQQPCFACSCQIDEERLQCWGVGEILVRFSVQEIQLKPMFGVVFFVLEVLWKLF